MSDIRRAVDQLYAKLSAGDAAALAFFLPDGGFTEFNSEGPELKTLDLGFFEAAIKAGVRIDLRAVDINVKVLSGAGIVTGYREGSIVLPDGTKLEGKQCLTMVWCKEASAWKLRHVHLSSATK